MAQSRADNMKLVGTIKQMARAVIKKTLTATAVNVIDPSDIDAKLEPIGLDADTLAAANHLEAVLASVVDLSAAEPSVVLVAAGKLLARFGTMYSEDPADDAGDEAGPVNAVFTAAAGLVLGIDSFVADVASEQEEDGEEDDADFEDDDSEGEEVDNTDDEDEDDADLADDEDDEEEVGHVSRPIRTAASDSDEEPTSFVDFESSKSTSEPEAPAEEELPAPRPAEREKRISDPEGPAK